MDNFISLYNPKLKCLFIKLRSPDGININISNTAQRNIKIVDTDGKETLKVTESGKIIPDNFITGELLASLTSSVLKDFFLMSLAIALDSHDYILFVSSIVGYTTNPYFALKIKETGWNIEYSRTCTEDGNDEVILYLDVGMSLEYDLKKIFDRDEDLMSVSDKVMYDNIIKGKTGVLSGSLSYYKDIYNLIKECKL